LILEMSGEILVYEFLGVEKRRFQKLLLQLYEYYVCFVNMDYSILGFDVFIH